MQKEHIKKIAWFLREVAGLLDTALSDESAHAASKPVSEPIKTEDRKETSSPPSVNLAEAAFHSVCQNAEEADDDEEFEEDEDEEENDSSKDEIPEEFRSDGTVCGGGGSDSSDDEEHHQRRSVIDRHSVDAEILGIIQQSMPRGTLFSDISAKVHYPDHIIRQSLRRLKSVHIRDDGSRPKTYTMRQRWG